MNYKMNITRGRDTVEIVLATEIELAPYSVKLTFFSGFG